MGMKYTDQSLLMGKLQWLAHNVEGYLYTKKQMESSNIHMKQVAEKAMPAREEELNKLIHNFLVLGNMILKSGNTEHPETDEHVDYNASTLIPLNQESAEQVMDMNVKMWRIDGKYYFELFRKGKFLPVEDMFNSEMLMLHHISNPKTITRVLAENKAFNESEGF